ncbi:MAG: hypothetical protein LBJ00_12580 [Planctomycetaceae bacterium]|nr:hypothetical protein [Planctomycetaceae bacterium]
MVVQGRSLSPYRLRYKNHPLPIILLVLYCSCYEFRQSMSVLYCSRYERLASFQVRTIYKS